MAKVLIIDDEEALTFVVGRLLTNVGFEVDTASSGPEGLEKAQAGQPDAIIVDVMMPDMDGYEVCRRLRDDPRTAPAAIVVLTARGQLIDKEIALRAGADAHVPKPYKGQELIQLLHNLLRSHGANKPRQGQQLVIVRLSAGAGATTLTANLAASLLADSHRMVAAADTALEHGQLEHHLGLPPTWTWVEGDAADANVVARRLLRHESGMFLMPAPPPGARHPAPEETAAMLRIVRTWHDYVVVDTPFNLGPLAPLLIRPAKLVLLVLQPDRAVLNTAPTSVAAIQHLAGRNVEVWPVVNKLDVGEEAFQRELEQALQRPVMGVLPWASRASAQALAEGRPVVLGQPDSALATAVHKLADRIDQVISAQPLRRIPTIQN